MNLYFISLELHKILSIITENIVLYSFVWFEYCAVGEIRGHCQFNNNNSTLVQMSGKFLKYHQQNFKNFTVAGESITNFFSLVGKEEKK